jgi:hypothetical protein
VDNRPKLFFDEPSYESNCCLFVALFSVILGSFSIDSAIQLSGAMALWINVPVRVFLGKISSESTFFHGAKMVLVDLIIRFVFLALKIIQQTPTISLSIAGLDNKKVDVNRTVIRKFIRLGLET